MFTDSEIKEYILMYISRKIETLQVDYERSYRSFTETQVDSLDLIELIIAKVRIDLIAEVEKDIMRIYGVNPSRKEKAITSQNK